MAYNYILIAALFSTAGNLMLKISREKLLQESTLLEQYLNFYFIGALIFYVLNVFLFARALDTMQVNVAYPLLASLGFTFLYVTSWLLLDEKLQPIQMVGIFAIIIGIALLTNQSSN